MLLSLPMDEFRGFHGENLELHVCAGLLSFCHVFPSYIYSNTYSQSLSIGFVLKMLSFTQVPPGLLSDLSSTFL